MTNLRSITPTAVCIDEQEPVLSVWKHAGTPNPILFCHCTGVCARTWDPVIAHLAVDNCILAPDARGHGDSGKPRTARAYDWREFSGDVLRVLDAFDFPAGAWAVGHSGGAAALVLAELKRPGSFSRLVLLDAIIAPSEFFSTAAHLAHHTRKRRASFLSREEARLRLGSKLPMNRWNLEAFNAYIAHGMADLPDGGVGLKCPPEIEAWVYECGGMMDSYDRLGEVQSEILLVTAAESYMVEYVHLQHSRLPRASIITLPETGHFIPQEQPQQTASLISDWFLPPDERAPRGGFLPAH